ncbi:MAG TPA: secretin N-terminal domain-containing protein [Phycisphaerae bacterium]|nr:secretin N-terminal domain-containing protein [Phycisphaerae bacterium]
MTDGVSKAVTVFLAVCVLALPAAFAAEPVDRDAVVRALLERSRLLADARFVVPVGVYSEYLRATGAEAPPRAKAPVPCIAETGEYRLAVDADGAAVLKVELRLNIFDPAGARNLPVLSGRLAWADVQVNGKTAKLATVDGRLRFTPDASGAYTLTAEAPLEKMPRFGRTVNLDVFKTVRTSVAFDSPGAWQISADERRAPLTGTADRGTHGRIALTPRDQLRIEVRQPRAHIERPPRYELRGDVAWNLGDAAQQVTAVLRVSIGGGPSDTIELLLPNDTDRVRVAGPDVREFRVGPGRATVHLRGRVSGATVLTLSYERPLQGDRLAFGRLAVADGHWTAGTLVISNTAGGSEVLPDTMTGLRQMALQDIPSAAAGILPGPAVLAYDITSRSFSASVEVLHLGEFALRQSIADMAHYEVFLDRDGSVIGRARYEIRNRTRQFLRLELPPGARVLLARVNEKATPISPAAAAPGAWLLPLERSRPSVQGLVSFPVDVVFTCKVPALGRRGAADIPLPRIDLPVAYGWCEAYVPDGMKINRWSGPMKPVERFTSETATASLDYGYSELAEGYTRRIAAPQAAPLLSRIPVIDRSFTNRGKVRDEQTQPAPAPSSAKFTNRGKFTEDQAAMLLARNYWRAGRDFYDKGEYANAGASLEKVVELAPDSAEAANARRLLANRELLEGRLALKGKAAKAAAQEIQREAAEQTRGLAADQDRLVQEGLAAARAGRAAEARAKLQAAQSLTPTLLAQGSSRMEVEARTREGEAELKQLESQAGKEAASLRGRLGQLKAGGQIQEAQKLAQQIRSLEGDSPKLRKEMEELAVAGAQRSQLLATAQRQRSEIRALTDQLQNFDRAAALLAGQGQPAPGLKVDIPKPPAEATTDELGELVSRQNEVILSLQDQALKRQSQLMRLDRSREAPTGWARSQPSPPGRGSYILGHADQAAAETRVHVFRLKNVSARDAADSIHRILRAAGAARPVTARADSRTNSLIVSGPAQDLKLIEQFIARLDTSAAATGPGAFAVRTPEAELSVRGSSPSRRFTRWGGEAPEDRTGPTVTLDGGVLRPGAAPPAIPSAPDSGRETDPFGWRRPAEPTPWDWETRSAQPQPSPLTGDSFVARPADEYVILKQFQQRIRSKQEVSLEAAHAVRKAREALVAADSDERFDEAHRMFSDAMASLEHNRIILTPKEYYTHLSELQETARYATAKDENWKHRMATEARRILSKSAPRRIAPEPSPEEVTSRIAALNDRAAERIRNKDYHSARQALEMILDLDPHNRAAREQSRLLEQVALLRREREHERERSYETQKQLVDRRETEIPWYDQVRYPRDWRKVTLRREPFGAAAGTESEVNLAVMQRLQMKLNEAKFEQIEFKTVIEWLRQVSGLNIHVNWGALEIAGILPTTPVRSVNLTNVTVERALLSVLWDVGGATPLSYVVDEGVVTVSTKEDLSGPRYRRTVAYDIRDLIVTVPSFNAPRIELNQAAGNNAANEAAMSRQEVIQSLTNLITQSVDPTSWRGDAGGDIGSVQVLNGQLLVTQTKENQRTVAALIQQLREAKGPQVELGGNIARQRASGFLRDVQADFLLPGHADAALAQRQPGAPPTAQDQELQGFLQRNYDWAIPRGGRAAPAGPTVTHGFGGLRLGGGNEYTGGSYVGGDNRYTAGTNMFTGGTNTYAGAIVLSGQVTGSGAIFVRDTDIHGDWADYVDNTLIRKLRLNLDQKVPLVSNNLTVNGSQASALGANWIKGNNDVTYAVIDEGQFRALAELDAAARQKGYAVARNDRFQETIIGTDALLANAWTANLTFAGEKGNRLDVNDNAIALPHERYVLIDNGDYLTVVKAGEMQHWREQAPPVLLAEVPQTIEVPRVGQPVKFEKTLLEPSDEMILHLQYSLEGASK